MAVLWIICGAGRGVGKSHLADRLCEVLPGSVCAKLGHGRRKPAGRANFFRTPEALRAFLDAESPRREHVVVESNQLAAFAGADVVIYLAPRLGAETDVRPDAAALAAAATVRIEPGATRSQWNRALARPVRDAACRRAVLDVLAEQAAYLAGPAAEADAAPVVLDVTAHTKLWFEHDGRHVLGRGLAELLEGVEATGSLSRSAAAASMSYRHAWNLVHEAGRHLGEPAVIARSGGQRGGGTVLSPAGLRLLRVFRRLDADVSAFAARRLTDLMNSQPEEDPDDA